MRKLALSLICAGALFGLCAGYAAAWSEAHMSSAGVPDKLWTMYAIAGLPGDMVAETYAGDWGNYDAWEYRGDIAVWNALFWTSLSGACAFLCFAMRRVDPISQHSEIN